MSTPIEIKEQIEQFMLSLPGVTGVGLGHSSPDSIHIYLKSACPKITCNIPESIGGVPVKQIVTGTIRALQLPIEAYTISRSDKFRPAPGGVSMGHYLISAGTLGVVCYDNTTGEKLILSNNHVLANSSTIQNIRARKGDLILQPGLADNANIVADKIGNLERWVAIDELLVNDVDCALAKPTNPEDITDEILEIGRVTEIDEPQIGDIVRKSGRSTGLTTGAIIDVNATIQVEYSTFGTFAFQNQTIIETPGFIAPGDSGSLLVRQSDNKAVGLCFAGTETIGIACRMTLVAQALNINLGGRTPAPSLQGKGNFWGTAFALGIPFMMFMKAKGRR